MEDRRQLFLFYGAALCMAAAMGIHESTFNNFLSDTFALSAGSRGNLELLRELPGLLVVIMAGLLAALSVTQLGLVGGWVMVAGLAGIGLLGRHWGPMLVMMFIISSGMHLMQPVGQSIAIGMSGRHDRGKRLAQADVVGTIGSILGTGFVYLAFRVTPHYRLGFLIAAVLAGGCAVLYGAMHLPHLVQPRARWVMKKKYSLYYALEFFFGARKQIFITFGPWVLIKIYGREASSIAVLMLVAAAIGIVTKTLAGWAIDRFGERNVLVADGLVLCLVCLGYGYAGHLTHTTEAARLLASACYILDNLLFAVGYGRMVYVSHLTETPQELTSTLSMGVSINHIVSMTIPSVAGAIWVAFGYQRVFLGAAVLAVCISLLASRVPVRPRAAAPAAG
ncbi:MAG: MFS transporter [bacterium]|nr:MFS transporter [bacterium]